MPDIAHLDKAFAVVMRALLNLPELSLIEANLHQGEMLFEYTAKDSAYPVVLDVTFPGRQ